MFVCWANWTLNVYLEHQYGDATWIQWPKDGFSLQKKIDKKWLITGTLYLHLKKETSFEIAGTHLEQPCRAGTTEKKILHSNH
jgi:hypothetical protein